MAKSNGPMNGQKTVEHHLLDVEDPGENSITQGGIRKVQLTQFLPRDAFYVS